jgi:putative nucleotidyltransferase with HDIG domain
MAEKRILIADADPNAWNEFRQALGESWVVVGAASGGAAMTEAQKQPFDVAVANYDLAELDGAEFLNRLRIANPKTLRFIAAAEAQREKVVCHVLGGHQFLPVPYERATLKSSIERSLADDYGMSQNMRELVARIRTFPTIPSLYIDVVNALKDPNATTEDIGTIIAKDMAMTTKLVQVLNSAYFGLPRTITDPTEAVGILGFETVKSLIMTVKLLSQYDKVKPVYFSIDNIWKHSTNVARSAKALALLETGDNEISGHAYTAGLMHDLGKVILAANFDDQYNGAHALARKNQVPLWEVEKDIFGASHGEIGAYLLRLWGMSSEVIRVAALHHQPMRGEDVAFSALTAVHVANALEYEGNATSDGLPLAVIDTTYLQQLGLENRVDAWRDAQRDPEAILFEARLQRAKSAAKSAAKPAAKAVARGAAKSPASPAMQAAAPVPKVNKFTPVAAPPAVPWRSLSKWVGLGLGISAVLAFLGWLEIKRLEETSEQPDVPAVAEHFPPSVKQAAGAPAPAKAPTVAATVTPPQAAPAMAAQPKPTPIPSPAPVPAPAAAPAPLSPQAAAKAAFDRLKLEAIFFSAQHPSALINGQLAGVNQLVSNCRVLDISPSTVTLEYQHQRKTLTLQ